MVLQKIGPRDGDKRTERWSKGCYRGLGRRSFLFGRVIKREPLFFYRVEE